MKDNLKKAYSDIEWEFRLNGEEYMGEGSNMLMPLHYTKTAAMALFSRDGRFSQREPFEEGTKESSYYKDMELHRIVNVINSIYDTKKYRLGITNLAAKDNATGSDESVEALVLICMEKLQAEKVGETEMTGHRGNYLAMGFLLSGSNVLISYLFLANYPIDIVFAQAYYPNETEGNGFSYEEISQLESLFNEDIKKLGIDTPLSKEAIKSAQGVMNLLLSTALNVREKGVI